MRHALLAAIFALSTALIVAAQGPPASVNSLGFGRSFAPPPSVTSLGPNGFSNLPVLLGNPAFPTGGFHIGGRHGHHLGFGGVGAVVVPYYVPTPVYVVPEDIVGEQGIAGPQSAGPYAITAVAEHQSRYGTHYLDRPDLTPAGTAPAMSALITPQPTPAKQPAEPAAQMANSSLESQPETVLIFKDGHRVEITNYAIQGTTLFNLSGEGPRKINLTELDVAATTKENDDRGVEFQLP